MSARSLVLTALLAASTGQAQEQGSRVDCDDGGWGWNSASVSVCEVREITMPANGALSVDARANGSVRVNGDDRNDVQVHARVRAWGRDETEAEELVSQVTVRSGTVLRAEGPSQHGRSGWSVSYDVLTPREADLSLQTMNGGIAVAGVRGDLELEALNGGISVDGVAGNVRGRTTNGGIEASLTGDTWEGAGLDLRTTNGGIELRIPEDYSARLETRTVNGSVDIGFPVTVQGRVGREISTTLGNGGPLVRAATTNGQVRVSRR